MSTLISGSVADHGSPDYPRIASFRTPGAYDPFTARPYGRYSPPRDFIDSPLQDHYVANRMPLLYDPILSRSVTYPTAQTFPGEHVASYLHCDRVQRLPLIEHETASRRQSQDSYGQRTGSPLSQSYTEYENDSHRRSSDTNRGTVRYHTRRKPFTQDEFDGPSQYLPIPLPQQDKSRAQGLLELPVHLDASEQDEVMRRANDILAECAFHFVAKYQFPIPLERDKPRVRSAADREWTEWAYLLKRLATKRRIPARVLYDNQIKQLVTTLENSIAARQSAAKDQIDPRRKLKDDRYILQLVSAGTQVAMLLMDSLAMEQLNELYARTEAVISERRHG